MIVFCPVPFGEMFRISTKFSTGGAVQGGLSSVGRPLVGWVGFLVCRLYLGAVVGVRFLV